jgi:23S rRNA pseudouridine1911/1915/1917 synthase
MDQGAVSLDGVVAKDPSRPASPGARFRILSPTPTAALPQAEDLPLTLLYEDDHLIVVDKPAGMAAHPAPGTPRGTLVNALLHHCGGRLSGVGGVLRPGIVHRLDKDTTGVMVVAKTDAAHQGLSRLFAAHDIDRQYVAFLRGSPRVLQGSVETQLGRSRYDRQRMAVLRSGGRRALTRYAVQAEYRVPGRPEAAAVRVACTLETGRTHQIRVHMAHLGAPVLGDSTYGAGGASAALREAMVAAGLGRQALHAARLGFEHPVTGARLSFETAPPEDLQRLETELGSRFFAAPRLVGP